MQSNKKHKILRILAVTMTAACFLASCHSRQDPSGLQRPDSTEEQKTTKTYFAFGTVIQITVYAADDVSTIQSCFDYLDQLEKKISVTLPDSMIFRLNQAGQGEMDEEVLSIIRTALRVSDLSEGAYDLSTLPLKNLWRIEEQQAVAAQGGDTVLPTAEQVADAVTLVDYFQVHIEDSRIILKNGMGLDLGGIAKGVASDICAQILQKAGVREAIANLGGNVRTLGDREYRVGLRDPRGDAGTVFALVTMREGNIVTSGDYERFFERDGVRYHHIFDPQTGMPAQSGVISVSIIGPDGGVCDALSTAVLVMGKEKGLALIDSLDGYEAILVQQDKKVYATSGAKDMLQVLAEGYELQ